MLSRRFVAAILLLMLFATSARAGGATALPAFTANYTVHSLSMQGLTLGTYDIELSTGSDGRHHYQAHTRTTGMLAWFYKDRIDEHSVWDLGGSGIRPLSYSYQRVGGKKEKRVELRFDWANARVRNIIDGDGWRMDIPPGTLDKLVVTLAVMRDLQQGRTDMKYAIADGGKLKTYRFRVLGEERLTTPAGEYDTVKLERVRNDNRRATQLWCAPKLGYLPVRIDQREEDDSKYSMLLANYNAE